MQRLVSKIIFSKQIKPDFVNVTNYISSFWSRMKLLHAEVQQARKSCIVKYEIRECSFVTKFIHFDKTKQCRFFISLHVVKFNDNQGLFCLYPYSEMPTECSVQYGEITEENILGFVKGLKRGLGFVRKLAKIDELV